MHGNLMAYMQVEIRVVYVKGDVGMTRKKMMVAFPVALSIALLLGFAASAQIDDCPYWDSDYEEPTMYVGGEAISGALALLGFAVPDNFLCETYPGECFGDERDLYYYVSGSTTYVRYWYWDSVLGALAYKNIKDLPMSLELPFRLWDFDENGVPDKVQLELLTQLLCLPEGVQHPLVDLDKLRSDMIANEAQYENLAGHLFSIRQEMVDAWPLLSQSTVPKGVGWLIRSQLGKPGMPLSATILDDPLIFKSGVIPETFAEATWGGLAYFLIDIGDAFKTIDENWDTAELALNNEGAVHLFAAVFGMLEVDVWDIILQEALLQSLSMAMYLDQFDWEYIYTKFNIIDGPDLTVLENAINALDFSPEMMPSPETIDQFDWDALFDGYPGEGEFVDETIEDTYLTTYARVVQASPDAPTLDICQNGVTLFEDVSFKEVTPYSLVTAPHPEFTYGFSAVEADGDCGAGVALADVDMPNTFTMVVLNTYSTLESLVLDDNVAAPVNGTAKLRFVNASPDAGALDVVAGAQTLFANVAFKGVGAFIEVLPGAYTVDFMSAGKGEKALPPADIVLNSGSVYTLYAMGSAGSVEVEITEDVEAPDLVAVDAPERKAYFAGESFELTAQVDSGATPSAYAWYRDGVLLEGTEPTLTIENAGPGDSGRYTAVVTVEVEGTKAVTQLSDTTDLIMVYAAPEVSIAGVSSVKFAEPITLSASLAPFDPVGLTDSYTWTQDGTPVSTTADLSIPYADDDMNGDECGVTAVVALADYPEVTRTVYAGQNLTVALPSVSISGKSVVEIMGTVTLAATISGVGTTPLNYGYIWTYNTDGNVQVFSTESTMVREDATSGFTGTYKVSVALNVTAQPDIKSDIYGTYYVRVTDEEMPVASAFGLAFAAAACAMAGAAFLKRKK